MLSRIFGPERDEATGQWRRLHDKELFALYSSPHIRVMKSRRQMGWACSACVGEERFIQGFSGET